LKLAGKEVKSEIKLEKDSPGGKTGNSEQGEEAT
jgi:hypothetical protein